MDLALTTDSGAKNIVTPIILCFYRWVHWSSHILCLQYICFWQASFNPSSTMSTPTSKAVTVITSAAQGIGKAIALRLAYNGFNVAVNDISLDVKITKLQEVQAEIIEKGCWCGVFPADVSNEENVKSMVKGVIDTLGGLDVVSYHPQLLWTVLNLTEDGSECRHMPNCQCDRLSVWHSKPSRSHA